MAAASAEFGTEQVADMLAYFGEDDIEEEMVQLQIIMENRMSNEGGENEKKERENERR